MRKYLLLIILVLIFCSPVNVRAADENLNKGAELYWQATKAINNKDFLEAKAKYEEAAQYLSGKLQADALKMVEFINQMSSEIIEKDIIADNSNFIILGEVKEDDKVWHLYSSENGMSILHLATKGQMLLEDLMAAIGSDLFSQKEVIENVQGYLSQDLSYFPESVSRIRMWYCDKNDTTNIVYESFLNSGQEQDSLDFRKSVMDEAFSGVKCSRFEPITIVRIIVIGLFLLLGWAIYQFRLWQKVSKRTLVIIIIVIVVLSIIPFILFLMSMRVVKNMGTTTYYPSSSHQITEEQSQQKSTPLTDTSQPKTETSDLGSITAQQTPKTWTVNLPANFEKVELAHYDKNNPTTVKKYMGWNGYLKVNGQIIWEFKSWSQAAGGLIYDGALGQEVSESSGSNLWIDATSFFKAGSRPTISSQPSVCG